MCCVTDSAPCDAYFLCRGFSTTLHYHAGAGLVVMNSVGGGRTRLAQATDVKARRGTRDQVNGGNYKLLYQKFCGHVFLVVLQRGIGAQLMKTMHNSINAVAFGAQWSLVAQAIEPSHPPLGGVKGDQGREIV